MLRKLHHADYTSHDMFTQHSSPIECLLACMLLNSGHQQKCAM
jgi:hypothetical protein